MKLIGRYFFVFIALLSISYAMGQVTIYPQDTYVDQGISGANYGGAVTMRAGRYSSGSVYSQRALLKFDLSGIPSGAIITSAELKVYRSASVTNTPLYIGRNTSTWSAGSVTWNNKPGYSTSDLIAVSSSTVGWLTVDVTNHVQGMVDGDYSDYGWVVLHQNESSSTAQYIIIHAVETSGTSTDPHLLINYYVPMSVAGAAIVHESAPGESDGSISPSLTGGPGGTYTYQWYNASGIMSGKTALNLMDVPYGWYGLEVTNPDMDPFYYAFLVGLNCQQVPIEFNPGPDYIDDAMVDNHSSGVNANYGSSTAFMTESWTSGSWFERHSLMRHRLWVDDQLNVASANLTLIGNGHNPLQRPNDAELVRITEDWKEFEVTYMNQPAFSNDILTDMPPTTGSTQNTTVQVADFWNFWKQNNLNNYGIVFKLDTYIQQYTRQRYYSSDNTSSANRPTINFQVAVFDSNCLPYNELKRSLDGGYAIALDGMIKFTMDEEYAVESSKYLPITIYDQSHQVLERSDSDGNVQNASITPLDLKFDDNRWTLDISGIPGISVGSFYTIEVTTGKGDKRYLRFLYKN